ncbi:hypothetical protein HDU67_000727, partial [Dinochytrium kinnereticum]
PSAADYRFRGFCSPSRRPHLANTAPAWTLSAGLDPNVHLERIRLINNELHALYNPSTRFWNDRYPKIGLFCFMVPVLVGHMVLFVFNSNQRRSGSRFVGGVDTTMVMGVLWILWVFAIITYIYYTTQMFKRVRANLFRMQSEWSLQSPVIYTFNNLHSLWAVSRLGVSLTLSERAPVMILAPGATYVVQGQQPYPGVQPQVYIVQHQNQFQAGGYNNSQVIRQDPPPLPEYSGPSSEPPKYA